MKITTPIFLAILLCSNLHAQNKKEMQVTIDSFKLVVQVMNDQVKKKDSEITDLNGNVSQLQNSVKGLEADNSNLNSDLKSCEGKEAGYKSKIKELESASSSGSRELDSIKYVVDAYFSNKKENTGTYVPATPEEFESFGGN